MEAVKTYDQGHNDFSDKSFKKIIKTKTGLNFPKKLFIIDKSIRQRRNSYSSNLPIAVNHTKYMQPIKDQKGKRFIKQNKCF